MFTENINSIKEKLSKINPKIGDLVKFNIGDEYINSYFTVFGIVVNLIKFDIPDKELTIDEDNMFLVVNYNNNNYLLSKLDVELLS